MNALEYLKQYTQVLESLYVLQSLEGYLKQQLTRLPPNPYEPEKLHEGSRKSELTQLKEKMEYTDKWRTRTTMALMQPPLWVEMALAGVRNALIAWAILRLAGLLGIPLQNVIGGPIIAFLTWVRELPWLFPKLLLVSELVMLVLFVIQRHSAVLVSAEEEYYSLVAEQQAAAERTYKLQLTLLGLLPLRRSLEKIRKLYEDKHVLPDSCQTYVAADLLCDAMETGAADTLEDGVAMAEQTMAGDTDLQDPHKAEGRWKFFPQIRGLETLHRRNEEAMQIVDTVLNGCDPLVDTLPQSVTDWLTKEGQKQKQYKKWIQQEAGSPASG